MDTILSRHLHAAPADIIIMYKISKSMANMSDSISAAVEDTTNQQKRKCLEKCFWLLKVQFWSMVLTYRLLMLPTCWQIEHKIHCTEQITEQIVPNRSYDKFSILTQQNQFSCILYK